MKFNKISMVLAALAFVGCSSEDLNEFSATPAVEDSNLIQLGSDFVLAGVSAEGTTTRTHWEQYTNDEGKKALRNKFLPIWTVVPNSGDVLSADVDETAQSIGLCWLGQSVGTNVYTNYQFYHFGWLNKNQTKATFDCGKLTNGGLYSEIEVTPAGGEAVGDEAVETTFTGYTATSGKTGTPSAALNFNTGIYKTENKSIFGGQYIVYYPYNENFKDAGTIPATAVTNWANAPMAYDAPDLGPATFRYSAPVTIEGGNQAANFGLKNLSALVRLRVAAPAGDAYLGNTIDQIVLFSESKQLLKQANLAADKIAAGATGADLYASTEGTKTIVANSAFALQAVDASPLFSPYITVLPTTVDDLVVFVHNQNQGKWARVNLGKTEFKAGDAKNLTITVANDDFTTDYIAVDENSLTTALNNARAEILGDASARPTITVIGDITLGAATYFIDGGNDTKITIKGDDIIVPQDVTLYLKTIMQSNVRVLGRSCCTGAKGGRLEVEGGTISNVTLEETEASTKNDNTNPELKYTGAKATVAAGKTVDVQAGNVIVNVAVEHKGDIKIAKDAKLTVNGTTGDLNFMGSTVTNNGTIEVMKDGNFDMTNSKGGATADDGKRMTNNGKFIHNVDAGVGTAVQSMVQNGEYRCKVDDQIKLSDAYQQWTACSVIEMVNTLPVNYNLGIAESDINYQHNGKYIDIEVNSVGAVTTFDNPLDANNKADNKEIMIGNLTVKAGGLDIDFVNDDANPDPTKRLYFKRTLTVNGNMTVSANTTMTDSKKINVTKNLTVNSGKTLIFAGNKANEDGLAVTKDINVTGTFNAGAVNALNITCANFTVNKNGKAYFGNRTDGASKNMVVSNTIDNKAGGEFDIYAATGGNVLAWVSCKELKVGGSFPHSRPRVVE